MVLDDSADIWVLVDDRAGNRSQALGVAEALGLPFQVKELAYGGLAAVPNVLMPASFLGLTQESRQRLTAPWPRMVIAAGRRTAAVARRIRQLSGHTARLVQIMHPGGHTGDFDLIAVPRHDAPVAAPNILRITGSPHGLTPAALAEARAQWEPRLAHLPQPRLALLVGGTTRRRRFTPEMAAELGRLASGMAEATSGSLMVATSRRTGDAAEALVSALQAPAEVYQWGQGDENPYRGFLASADGIIVTGESMSMCSEACAETGPVYIYAPEALITAKHRRFHETLYEDGYARPLDGTFEAWSHPALNAAAEVVQAIRERLK